MTLITPSADYLRELRNLVEPKSAMQKHGYVTRPLTDEELLQKRRCVGCGKAMSQLTKKAFTPKQSMPTNEAMQGVDNSPSEPTVGAVRAFGAPAPDLLSAPADVPALAVRCKHHPGQIFNKYWSCCNQHVSAQPCGGSNEHIPRAYAPNELADQHQVHYTPVVPSRESDIRAVVAIDCEMGMAESGDSELIRVTLIDYFTDEVLVDNLVEPDVPMRHLNTQYSGVTWSDMRRAQRQGTCLKGKAMARAAVWWFVGTETVVVGHGVSNDLRAMRWVHALVVDSFVIEFGYVKRKEAEIAAAAEKEVERTKAMGGERTVASFVEQDSLLGDYVNAGTPLADMPGNLHDAQGKQTAPKAKKKKGSGNLALKNLVEKRLHRQIQMAGKAGHDSLEDAIAARDLVHWIIMNPDCER